jgi:hypothetical protein
MFYVCYVYVVSYMVCVHQSADGLNWLIQDDAPDLLRLLKEHRALEQMTLVNTDDLPEGTTETAEEGSAAGHAPLPSDILSKAHAILTRVGLEPLTTVLYVFQTSFIMAWLGVIPETPTFMLTFLRHFRSINCQI